MSVKTVTRQTIQHDRLLILDFGSQYAQLIARRVREAGVYCELWPHASTAEKIKAFKPNGIILSGGPETVLGDDTPRLDEAVFALGVPILGICYGMQTMAAQLGGEVQASTKREFGHAAIELIGDDALVRELQAVWMSHGDKVSLMPDGFEVIAKTDNAPIAAMADSTRHFYGVQFHPEVTHTKNGQRLIEAFAHEICGCASNWTADNIIQEAVKAIESKVGSDKVLLALSGGVDSSVVAMLLHKAIGDQLVCVFVDTGLLRHQEAEQVMTMFKDHEHLNVIKVDAAERFYDALKGEADPEAKRKIIGGLFIDVFEEEAEKLQDIKWLAQGTIYPDIIESGASSDAAHVIKSHHNVGGLPEDMNLKLVEPIRDLFKDEVRKIGVALGLPHAMLYRHPFPGTGLGIRILGEVKPEYIPTLQLADHIFMQALRDANLYDEVAQAFAVFLPVKSVAVKGDARAYEYVIALRAVKTVDFMTAHWAELPYDFLTQVSNRICNEVPHVSRVVYDISGKPPATIEWE
jgi:GMP synthase (glutamine-hydrolysing)